MIPQPGVDPGGAPSGRIGVRPAWGWLAALAVLAAGAALACLLAAGLALYLAAGGPQPPAVAALPDSPGPTAGPRDGWATPTGGAALNPMPSPMPSPTPGPGTPQPAPLGQSGMLNPAPGSGGLAGTAAPGPSVRMQSSAGQVYAERDGVPLPAGVAEEAALGGPNGFSVVAGGPYERVVQFYRLAMPEWGWHETLSGGLSGAQTTRLVYVQGARQAELTITRVPFVGTLIAVEFSAIKNGQAVRPPVLN